MKLRRLLEKIREEYPEEIQYSWDNSSLNLGDLDQEIRKVMLSLEINDRTVDEAIDKGVDLIISHHPFLFSKINKIDTDSTKGRLIYKMIRNNISGYCMHTSYDLANKGLNDYFFDLLGVSDRDILEIDSSLESYMDGQEYGLGRVGYLEKSIKIADLIDILKNTLNIKHARYVGNTDLKVTKVAVVTGSGAEYYELAKKKGCDLLITGDLKYHQAMDALDLGMSILDLGHYGTEHIFSDSIYKYIKSIVDDAEIIISEANVDPFIFV
nr:Nif3-like dinuclear metal center hexameric protein [uncultured Peptostreptococcus sp.]